jgi:AraC-like DNA-binding protein
MTSLVRSSNLDAYEALTRSIGVDPVMELMRFGLPVDTLQNPDTFIPFIGFIRLLEHTALAGSCPDFGLRLAQRQGAGSAGPLLILMRHAATLEEALLTGARHLFVLSPNYLFSIVPVKANGALVDLTIDIDVPQVRLRPQTIEHSLGYMVQLVRLVTQGQAQPLLAMLPHPRMGPLQSYTDVLGCPCRFDAPVAAVRMAARDLSLPLPDRNPLLQQMALSYIEEHFGAPDKLISEQVRLLARRFLDTGDVSQRDIANALAVHPKTLQRRLLAEGQVFNDIVDEVRRDRFLELIAQPTAPSVAQLAQLLGYSEQAALTRGCRRWFGQTPTALRRQRAPESSSPGVR